VALLILILVLIGCAFLAWAAAVWLAADSILRPPRMSDAKAMAVLGRLSPGDLSMPFERMFFQVRDSATEKIIPVSAWWLARAGGGSKCVILIHGYADAKVGSIAWAGVWQAMGFHVLAIDLRAHGESGGRFVTAGWFERDDVDQIINEFRAARPDETKQLVLAGFSMGAAVAAATAARRDDLAALVLDSPFADYRGALLRHAELRRLPDALVMRPAVWLAERRSGARFEQIRPIDLVEQITCPTLIIHGSEDAMVPAVDREAFARRRHPQVMFPSAGHLRAMQADFARYREVIERHLGRSGE